ncbi:substrate-binding domain-containing protein [Pseudomonas sp. GX19020]|uniref:LacI family DNA-binding transcriptional regulator n=1 Tax=Pseudomonas sp. GX19020 TaxID=2942277 RepID=UPI0020196F25|nr:LacI family DNA-binding transcriptional regulator [Pseudomonas sp. GX19020]MCL4068397.1 substrate-binding domain-containing protein [Pseudomonas sp. GX19020]
MAENSRMQGWKGPTVKEVARLSGLGPATVDRVLNNRPGVREKTRNRVVAALDKLSQENQGREEALDLRLFCESGTSFNAAMDAAADAVNRSLPGVRISGFYLTTREADPALFARQIEQGGCDSDGVIVVAREHPAINAALRKLGGQGVPVVCLTSDLPSSRRAAYVGNDQYAAGSVAAFLIGSRLSQSRASILIVSSVPFRCQKERVMGFRRVLRSEFPHLRVQEQVIANDDPETTHQQLISHFHDHGVPLAIYNVAGANRGIAWALEALGRDRDPVFVGHELTPHSRDLLGSGVMDFVISHDFTAELSQAALWIRDAARGVTVQPAASQILLHTKYNCAL